jgi:hypothetical protein
MECRFDSRHPRHDDVGDYNVRVEVEGHADIAISPL